MNRLRGEEPTGQTREIDQVIAIMSGKGGVGKSSVAGLLAAALQRRGPQVVVLDADITGPSIPKMFGVHQQPTSSPSGILLVESRTGIKLMSINLLLQDKGQPVVWRGPLIGRAIEQFWRDIAWGKLDYLIIDLPPGTSDAVLTVAQMLPVKGIVLVDIPTRPGRHGGQKSRPDGHSAGGSDHRAGGEYEPRRMPGMWDGHQCVWPEPN